MDSTNALGEFLRARRELVRPEDVGISGGGLRRVAGLRRWPLDCPARTQLTHSNGAHI
jgi:hypothetical protein